MPERKSDNITNSEDLRRAEIIAAGKKAQRSLAPAQQAAQKAWQDWRMLGTFKNEQGQITVSRQYEAVTRRVPKPGSDRNPDGSSCTPIMMEQRVDDEVHPEHARLKAVAEAADRHVLDLQDDLDIYTALVGNLRRSR
jgi:hypothetical protein